MRWLAAALALLAFGCGGAAPSAHSPRPQDTSVDQTPEFVLRHQGRVAPLPVQAAPAPPEQVNRLPAPRTAAERAARIRLYERAVADRTRDPERARFRNTRLVQSPRGEALCGELLAINAYGGPTGFLPFFAQIISVGTRQDAVLAVPFVSDAAGIDEVNRRCGD